MGSENEFAVCEAINCRPVDLNDTDNLIRESVHRLAHNTLSLSCIN